VYTRRRADLSSISFNAFGTESKNRTSTSSWTFSAVTMVFVVAILRPNDSARLTSSL
jgi:hypothetical protein